MFHTQTPHLPFKPLVINVRLTILLIAGYAGLIHAQEPAFIPNNHSQALPYCNDTPADALKPWPKGSTSATGDTIKGSMNQTLILNGKACVLREDAKIQGNTIQYDYPTEQVTATGNAILRTAAGDEISGPAITYNVSTRTGGAAPADFKISATGGRGKAESLSVLSSRRALMQNTHYTTCRAQDPDWYLKSNSMLIDQDQDLGMTTASVLVFKNVPILATPYAQFPLGNHRHSGLLTPTMGYSGKSGVELTVPYYFNLAPNYDLTIYPGFMSNRGAKLSTQYRYLTRHSSGDLYADYLLNDQVAKRDRWYYSVQHKTASQLAGGTLQASVDAQRASDNSYLDNFKAPNIDGSTRVLPSEFALQYNRPNWQIRLREKTNQTLQNSSNNVDSPYNFEPQLSVIGSERIGNWVTALDTESTRFSHPDKVTRAQGWRHVAYPSLRYEYRKSGFFATPKVGLNATQYDLSYVPNTAYDAKAGRVLPIASVDSGLIFERNNASWLGRPAIQTLEPRLYYEYVPYKDQSNIWNFDSALADFDLARIYSENIFTGRDRVSNANQFTTGITSRWLSQDSGEELFQITAAQRRYIDQQRVTLPGESIDTQRKSDLLLSASGQVSKQLYLDSFGQYNIDQNKMLKSDVSLRWQPAAKKIINIGFHENRILTAPTKTIYTSAQWPLSAVSKNLYGVARVNYDIENQQLTDAFTGFEYVKDCWIFRLVGQRSIASTGVYNNSVFFQLELKGLGALGNDPIPVLRSGIPGYSEVKFSEEEIDSE